MDLDQSFGGRWTEEKLGLLTKYLKAYVMIFTKNPRARSFHTIYVDAFAGTGYIHQHRRDANQADMFEDIAAEEAQGFIKGSAVRTLELAPGFGEYLFIEKDPERFRGLAELRNRHRSKKILVKNVEANEYLRNWCRDTDWENIPRPDLS